LTRQPRHALAPRHTYSALLARIESLDFAVFENAFASSKPEKILAIARARFGAHTRENVLEKRDRDRGGLAGLAAGVALLSPAGV